MHQNISILVDHVHKLKRFFPLQLTMHVFKFLAYRIRKSKVFTWNEFLSHPFYLTPKRNFSCEFGLHWLYRTSCTFVVKLTSLQHHNDVIFNQRTSGPVNAHLTPGPGIYFNAFIHVNSPRPVADNPLGTNVDVNRKPLSLCPFVASFKTISLKYDFKHILNDFI